MTDIADVLQSLLEQYQSVDMVESEFLRLINEDEELMNNYKDWCESFGYKTKYGYKDYLDEILASKDSIWDTLREFEDTV